MDGWIGFEEEYKDQSRKPRKQGRAAINRKTKVNIVFDPDARRKFLTGFRKRKQERKAHYEEKLQKELLEEKQKMREEAKKKITKKQSSSHSILPEVEHLIAEDSDSDSDEEEQAETYEVGSTLVSISSLDDSIHRKLLPVKKEEEDDDDDTKDEDITDFLKYNKPSIINDVSLADSNNIKKKKIKPLLAKAAEAKQESLIRKEATRLLMQSDAYKKALRFKQKKSKKFKNNRLQPGARGGKKGIEAAAAAKLAEKSNPSGGAGKGGGKKKAQKPKSKSK